MSTVKEIERAVEKLRPKDLARLTAWMNRYLTKAGTHRSNGKARKGVKWFEVYMACPHAFEVPPRQKQFYKPKA